MDLREETYTILKETLGPEKAYKVLEYIDSRVKEDVATQKDIYELKLEIAKVGADLSKEIEKVRADLSKEIEKIRADLQIDIAKVRVDLLKWHFAFWLSQMALLTSILFKLLG